MIVYLRALGIALGLATGIVGIAHHEWRPIFVGVVAIMVCAYLDSFWPDNKGGMR